MALTRPNSRFDGKYSEMSLRRHDLMVKTIHHGSAETPFIRGEFGNLPALCPAPGLRSRRACPTARLALLATMILKQAGCRVSALAPRRPRSLRHCRGALVGGFVFTRLGASGITGFNLYSMVLAIIEAIIVLVIYHAIFGRKVT